MRACTKCGETKPLDAFPPVRRGEEKRQSWCRDCFAEANGRNYQRNHEREKARLLAQTMRNRTENRLRMISFLQEHPCVDCSESDIVVLEFDHLSGKTADVATLIARGNTWTRIFGEMLKCEVRCANCHRRKTAERWLAIARPRTPRSLRRAEQLRLDQLGKRRCRVCGDDKLLAEFPYRSMSAGTRHAICRSCQREASHDWYVRSRSPQARRILGYGTGRRSVFVEAVRAYFDTHHCVDCGEDDPRVLDFDHRRDKLADISTLVRRAATWNEVAAEVEKCEVRCANCHRRRTIRAQGGYRARAASA